MILPTKNISKENSLLWIGGAILSILDRPSDISKLWDKLKVRTRINSFEYYVLALDLLFITGTIDIENNRISKRVE